MPPKAYTIEDIAKELGVSKTTVSRAISGKGRIGPETRERVLQAIARHDFRPSAVARGLAQSRSYNLALVLPGAGAMDLAFFRECAMGLCRAAARRDYDVLIAMDEGDAVSQMERILANRKADGAVVARGELASPVAALLKERGLPFVVIGAGEDPETVYVDNSNRGACRELTALLLARGVRRPALLGGDENFSVTHSRYQGFADACLQAGLDPASLPVIRNVTDSARVSAALEQALREGADCVLCMDDFICHLALIWLRERGIKVPERLRLACFYDNPLLAYTAPSVTSLSFDAAELGAAACRELLALLEGGKARSRVLPGYRLILRDSTA